MSTSSYSTSESPFLNQVRRTIRLKHMSRRTGKSYRVSGFFQNHYFEIFNGITRVSGLNAHQTFIILLDYIYFHNKKHPEDMVIEEIRAYLSHLATDKKVAVSTQNIALSALLFLTARMRFWGFASTKIPYNPVIPNSIRFASTQPRYS